MSLKNNIILASAAASAMAAGFWLSAIQSDENTKNATIKAEQQKLTQARKNFSAIQGLILSPARKIAIPELVKDDGQLFTKNDVDGHWSLLYFGYTNCPDICPTTLGVTAQAKKTAESTGLTFPEVYFISVDPARDKVEMLADYVQYFDKSFTGVTGDSKMIKALTLQMSVAYMEMPAEDNASDNYQVDHSSALLLLNPEGKLAAFLNPPHDVKTILKDIQTVIKESSKFAVGS